MLISKNSQTLDSFFSKFNGIILVQAFVYELLSTLGGIFIDIMIGHEFGGFFIWIKCHIRCSLRILFFLTLLHPPSAFIQCLAIKHPIICSRHTVLITEYLLC